MDLLESLKSITKNAKTVNDYINGFEEFCKKVDCGDEEELCLLETGDFGFSGEDEFYFSLVRQYKGSPDDDEYIQVHMDIIFEPINEELSSLIWSDEFDNTEDFFKSVDMSDELKFINDNNIKLKRIDLYTEET